jgi:hypothetical protein
MTVLATDGKFSSRNPVLFDRERPAPHSEYTISNSTKIYGIKSKIFKDDFPAHHSFNPENSLRKDDIYQRHPQEKRRKLPQETAARLAKCRLSCSLKL